MEEAVLANQLVVCQELKKVDLVLAEALPLEEEDLGSHRVEWEVEAG